MVIIQVMSHFQVLVFNEKNLFYFWKTIVNVFPKILVNEFNKYDRKHVESNSESESKKDSAAR